MIKITLKYNKNSDRKTFKEIRDLTFELNDEKFEKEISFKSK